jgi:hypothetical protein
MLKTRQHIHADFPGGVVKNGYKVYVDVDVNHNADGTLRPRSFIREDGKRYEVDREIDVRPATRLKSGGAGSMYTICVGKRETFMFLEEDQSVDRWFMERK